MTRTKTITEAIAAQIAAIDGTGNYVNDLTGDDVVQRGIPSQEITRLPCVWVWLESTQPSLGPDLTGYSRRWTWGIMAYCTAATDSPSAREDAATDLLEDIIDALLSDPSIGGRIEMVDPPVGRTFLGSAAGIVDLPGVQIAFEGMAVEPLP